LKFLLGLIASKFFPIGNKSSQSAASAPG